MVAEILDVFKTRLSSPILMSIFVSFVLLNWQAFYYVIFSGAPTVFSVENWLEISKFDYWNNYMVWWRYLLPIPIGICYALMSPKLAYIAAMLTSKDVSAKRMLEKAEASKVLELEAELQEARNFAAKAAIDKAELEERASNIKDPSIRGELEQNIRSIERPTEEIVVPIKDFIQTVETEDATRNNTNVPDSKSITLNDKIVFGEGHENFDENARKIEIELRYKALRNEAKSPSKSWHIIYRSIKKLREFEGPKSDPYRINDTIDKLMVSATAIDKRMDELDYSKEPIIYDQMSDEYTKIVSEILANYRNLEFEDDIPF